MKQKYGEADMPQHIGILTFQNTKNYGAILQAYALQKYLQSQGVNAEIINYSNRAVTERESPMILKNVHGVKEFLKFLLTAKADHRKEQAFSEFSRKYMIFSEEQYQEGQADFSNYTAVIAGSDQIWNLTLTGNDHTYFLDRCHCFRKFSYAASIGRCGIITQKEAKMLSQFRRVSVREQSACDELNTLGIRAETVLDPTFLLERDEWLKLCSRPLVHRKYVLLYQMTTSPQIFSFARKLAKKNHCVLVNANPMIRQLLESRCVRSASPCDWLSLIQNAEYVVTNSFHGLAFSINLRKNFFTEVADNETGSSTRIQCLLDICGLQSRNLASPEFSMTPIDYGAAERKLSQGKAKSKHYIAQILENIYDET